MYADPSQHTFVLFNFFRVLISLFSSNPTNEVECLDKEYIKCIVYYENSIMTWHFKIISNRMTLLKESKINIKISK